MHHRYAVALLLPLAAICLFGPPARSQHAEYNAAIGQAFELLKASRFTEAIPYAERAAKIAQSGLGGKEQGYSLAILGNLYAILGRFEEAEPIHKRALAVRERALGANHVDVANSLANLGRLYYEQERYSEAEALYKRALAVSEVGYSATPYMFTTELDNLARLYQDQGRFEDAEPLLKRSLEIWETQYGRDNPLVASSLSNLGGLYLSQGRYGEAEPLLRRALPLFEGAFGDRHTSFSEILSNLAKLYQAQKRYSDAERLHARALALREKTLGSGHPHVADSLAQLGQLARVRGRWPDAYTQFTLAGTIHMKRAAIATGRHAGREYFASARAAFVGLAEAAWHVAEEQPARRPQLEKEAFAAGQRATLTSTAAALSQMAVRFTSSGGGLGPLVRQAQDLSAIWKRTDKQLIEAISASAGRRNETAISRLRGEVQRIEERIAGVNVRLGQDFPAYAELSNPQPLGIPETQVLLDPNEALVVYIAGSDFILVWGVTHEQKVWRHIAIREGELASELEALRQGLDCRAPGQSRQEGGCSPWQLRFNLATANELYEKLLGPVADVITDKRHLIIVPSGILTSLPFNVLLAAPAAAPVPDHYAGYKDPPWLIKRHALTILPSISALKALRGLATAGRPDNPYIGFGDPIFSSAGTQPQRSQQVAGVRNFASYFKGRLADRDTLALLDPLPETATELKAIARTLGAPESEIYVRDRATEMMIKRTPLERYQVVHFATHGLVAGDVKGLSEPALAFTVPLEPSELDDGLLTASEAAQLKLNADWVILSACNTAAGNTPGAEALSGLARAFFYAGARALLVSHWPVESAAAVKLTTRTIAELKASPGIGRAEALRRAMLALMADRDVRHAHPALWAPFMVVGEGGAERRGVPRLISGPTLQRGGSLRAPQ
jgi:CHAT domain-containing protein/tetratricopeptide (TPR) repeat protein